MKPIPPSPLPIEGSACDCVELIIYDNDDPEGIYHRLRYPRSSEAIAMLMDCFSMEELDGYNFTLTNYWMHPIQ